MEKQKYENHSKETEGLQSGQRFDPESTCVSRPHVCLQGSGQFNVV